MEVWYKAILEERTDWNGLNPHEVLQFQVKFPDNNYPKIEDACCHDMKEAWNSGLVGAEKYNFNEGLLPKIQLQWTEPGYEGDTNEESVEIGYCPWCGEEILLKEVERVRKVKKEKQVTETKTIVEYEEVKVDVRE